MNAATEQKALVQTLVDEASDVDLVCYLARLGGETALKDLLECVRDAAVLSMDDLMHNISVVRQKKNEAHACPVHRVFRRLMKSEATPVITSMLNGNGFSPLARLRHTDLNWHRHAAGSLALAHGTAWADWSPIKPDR